MGYQMTEQYDGHWQESLSEETRQMISDASFQMWKNLFDEISITPHERRRRDRQQLGRRVREIAIDLELSGQENDARVLMLAAGELIGDE
jgi:hypothetical protein